MRGLLARSLSIGGAVIGFAAFFAVSYPVALLLLVVLVGTSPPAIRRLRRQPKREPKVDAENAENAGNSGSANGDAEVSEETESLSSAVCEETDLSATDVTELCRLLRHTFWDLRDTSDPAEKLRLVAHRQRIIDELARRDPKAVLVWLRSGARASGSPEKYFQPKPHSSGSDPA
jgi:predicted lipid-binding transport protein (Tim44 family)